jgi:N4-gp56 family major capsid protein
MPTSNTLNAIATDGTLTGGAGAPVGGNELFTNILQEALFTANERSVARELCRIYNITGSQGKTIQVPVYPTVSASAVAENVDLANTAINPTSVDISVSEFGVMSTITDLMMESSGTNLAADVGRILGEAMAAKLDSDVFALFSSFSTSVGDNNDAEELDADLIFKAVATLRSNNASGQYFGVFHPKSIYNLKKTLVNAGANIGPLSDIGNEALRSGIVGTVAGVTLIESTLVPTISSDGAVNAIFSADALGIALKRDMRMEEQRDASLRATEYVMTGAKGQGILQNSYGVQIVTDNSL